MRGHLRKYQLKDGHQRWAVVVYNGKRIGTNGQLQDSYRWIRGFKTQKLAQGELTKVLKSLSDGTYVEPSKQTLSEFLDRWLNTVEGNLAPKTFERYKQLVDLNINPRLGAIRLMELQPLQIAEFYKWSSTSGNRRTKRGLSVQTVLHIHRLFRQAMEQAVKWNLRVKNPCDLVDAPRPERKEMKPVEEDRAGALIISSEETDMYLPILMGLCTGMRRGEILGTRWSDLDLVNSSLTVNQSVCQTRSRGVFFKAPKKKKSQRTISLPEILVIALREHRSKQAKERELFGPDYQDFDLVLPMPDGNPWAPDRFTDAYLAFARSHGADGIRFHDLRHTHASELLRRKTPLKTVSQRLGHSNATVTLNTYAHVMSGDDEDAAKLVGTLLQDQLTKQRNKEPK